MSQQEHRIMLVSGSLRASSATRVVLQRGREMLEELGCQTDWVDLAVERLAIFNPDSSAREQPVQELRSRMIRADTFVLGTPDYHGGMSGGLKNFLDHFWHEFTGKLFVPLVASHEKGLTVVDQVLTVARQCYAWSLPYSLTFVDGKDVRDGKIMEPRLEQRLAMLARDVNVYGRLLAAQRAADLAGTDAGFLAARRHD